jgi:hypothetical protein
MNRYIVYQTKHGNITVSGEHQNAVDRMFHNPDKRRRYARTYVYVWNRSTPPSIAEEYVRESRLMGFPVWITDRLLLNQ